MTRRRYPFTPLIALALAACGGGGGGGNSDGNAPTSGSVTTNTAEGMWSGTTNNGANLTGVVLDNGSFYATYSTKSSPNVISGVILGTGQSNNGSYVSTDALDFNFGGDGLGVSPTTVSAGYSPKASLSGSLTYANAPTSTFTAQYNPVYEQPASATLAAGTYSGNTVSSAGSQTAFMTLQANGTVTGVVAGCNFSGTASPRGSVNVFNLSLTFHGGTCLFGTSTLNGIGFYSIPNKQFYAAAPNAARTDGFFFLGIRP